MRTSFIHTVLLGTLLATASASAASAASISVAEDCSGVSGACTTNLQAALDDSTYADVVLLTNVVKTGDFLIDRSLVLRGLAGSSVRAGSGSAYALRVERTSVVLVDGLDLVGQVAVYDSTDVVFEAVDLDADAIGLQIFDSSDVEIQDSTISADDRAIDVLDSTAVLVTGGGLTSGLYGVVGSSARVTVDDVDVFGASHAVVLQDGHNSTLPRLWAYSSDLTTDPGNTSTWAWDRSSRTYSGTPATETETTVPDLVTLIGYTPWGGD